MIVLVGRSQLRKYLSFSSNFFHGISDLSGCGVEITLMVMGFSDPLLEGDENVHGIKMNHHKFQPFTVCLPHWKCTADLVKLLILFCFFALCFFIHISRYAMS